MWNVAHWVSRAPPHQTFPAFLNLNGRRGRIIFTMIRDHLITNNNLLAPGNSQKHLFCFEKKNLRIFLISYLYIDFIKRHTDRWTINFKLTNRQMIYVNHKWAYLMSKTKKRLGNCKFLFYQNNSSRTEIFKLKFMLKHAHVVVLM